MLLTESGFDILKPKSALHGFLGNFSVFFRFKYPKEKIYEFFCEFLKKTATFPSYKLSYIWERNSIRKIFFGQNSNVLKLISKKSSDGSAYVCFYAVF